MSVSACIFFSRKEVTQASSCNWFNPHTGVHANSSLQAPSSARCRRAPPCRRATPEAFTLHAVSYLEKVKSTANRTLLITIVKKKTAEIEYLTQQGLSGWLQWPTSKLATHEVEVTKTVQYRNAKLSYKHLTWKSLYLNTASIQTIF